MPNTVSSLISEWVAGLNFEGIPSPLIDDVKFRILDVIGLSIVGGTTPFGRSVRAAGRALHPSGPAQLFGCAGRSSVVGAAFVNGALSQALEFDDTHNESIVHMSGPAVVSSLALAEARKADGRDVMRAVVIANEISARIGSAAPGQFHKRGFHPTGLFAPFGIAWSAGAMLGLDPVQMTHAAGIVGSFAAGLLECWVDGAQSKFLHPGWATQGGISAAYLAHAGTTGPVAVLEGRFGLFASHLQGAGLADPDKIVAGLGDDWKCHDASFKPYPAAHVIHPYLDAALRLRSEHGIAARNIARIICPVAPYIVGIVCEPLEEKRRPRSDSHGRVSLQYSLAEALVRGRLDRYSYAEESLNDPHILALADRVEFEVDPSFPGPERFKGQVRLFLDDGRCLEAIEEFNRGSPQNPMSPSDIIAKFETNVSGVLARADAQRLVEQVLSLEQQKDIACLAALTRGSHD